VKKLEFHRSKITSDAGLILYRELNETLGLTDTVVKMLADWRTDKNTKHTVPAIVRQLVFSRLAGYEDTNDAGSRCASELTQTCVTSFVDVQGIPAPPSNTEIGLA